MTGQTILISGASSGIGAALARSYAGPGAALILWGRDAARLQAVAGQCRALGAVCEIQAFDLCDHGVMRAHLGARDAMGAIDLAIFCAGIGGSLAQGAYAEAPQDAQTMAEVNFVSPITGASLIAGAMAKRGQGQIVLVGSIAESFALPMAPTYAASKAGLAMFARSLGLRMERFGVAVTLVSPGFIDTPMSRQVLEPKPFLMSADRAATIIARKIARRARTIVVPWQFAVLRGIFRLLPPPLQRLILRRA